MTVTINGTTGITTPTDTATTSVTTPLLTSPSSTALTIQSAGTTAMTVNTSQSIGIGTTSPAAKLDVVGDTLLAHQNSAQLLVRNLSGESCLDSYNDPITANYPLRLLGSYIRFLTSDAERMRIDSSGRFLLNTSSTINNNYIMSVVCASGTGGIVIKAYNTSTNYPVSFFNSSGTEVGNITNTTTNTAYNTSSDYRLKENVQAMLNGLETVCALKPVTYSWKIDGSFGEGFIAHEIYDVIPQAVSGEKDAVNEDGSIKPQSVDYSKIVVHLVAAMQELSAKNDALEARLAALEAK